MTIRVGVPAGELPKFFIGAEIKLIGARGMIEKAETLLSVYPDQISDVPLELTLLIL